MMKLTLELKLPIVAESRRRKYDAPGGRRSGRAVKTAPEFLPWVAN